MVAEGTGWDEYIDTAAGKLSPLKQRPRRICPGLGGVGAAFLPALSCSNLENDFPSYPESLGQLGFLEGFSHLLARTLARFEA